MSNNNDFNNNRPRPDLEEYLSNEITEYYGEDIINNIKNSSVPAPPAHRRKNRLISALGICCAVMFLTGAAIFSGVFFTSGVSVFGNGTSSDLSDTESTSSISHQTESNTDSDILSSSQSILTDTSEDRISTDKKSDTDITMHSSSEYHTDTENLSDITSNINTSDSDINSNLRSENPINTDSKSDTLSDITSYSNNSDSDVDYFSLPEYPDEGNIPEVTTDVYNNSSTNPYDNVTTGRQVRAGVGISLMILSLITALILNKIRDNL